MSYNEDASPPGAPLCLKRSCSPAERAEMIRAQRDALRSLLAQEKEQLRHDIVKTLRCQTALLQGPADLAYTSGLLERLKSLEKDRDSWGRVNLSSSHGTMSSGDTLGCCSVGGFEPEGHQGGGRENTKTKKLAGCDEVHRLTREIPHRFSSSVLCSRAHTNCSLEVAKTVTAQENPSNVQVFNPTDQMCSYSGHTISYPSYPTYSTSVPQKKAEGYFAKQYEDACKSRPSTTITAWSEEGPSRTNSFGYQGYEKQNPPDHDHYSRSDIPSGFQHGSGHMCRRSTGDQWLAYPNVCTTPVCTCGYCGDSDNVAPKQVQSNDLCGQHYSMYHINWEDSLASSPTASPSHHLHVHDESQAPSCGCHGPTRFPSHLCRHFCSPETSPRGKHHQQSNQRLHYKRLEMSAKNLDEDKSGINEDHASSLGNDDHGDDFAGSQLRRVTPEYAMPRSSPNHHLSDDNEGTCSLAGRKVQVSPRSQSTRSASPDKIAETMVFDRENLKGPGQDTAVEFHYANDLGNEKSGGSSLFGSDIALDQVGLASESQVASSQRRTSGRRQTKPRRKATKRSTRRDANDLSKASAAAETVVRSSRSTPHNLHSKAEDDFSHSAKTGSFSARRDRGRNPSMSKASWAPGDPSSAVAAGPPTASPHVSRRTKPVKTDSISKSMDTCFSSLRQKSLKRTERSEMGDVLDGDRSERILGDSQRRKAHLRILRPPTNFNFMLDELRNSPMLRGIALHASRK